MNVLPNKRKKKLLQFVLMLALCLSSRSPTDITQHTLEAFSVFQYCPGVHEISLDFETTQRALHRVKAVVHMTTKKAPFAGTQTNGHGLRDCDDGRTSHRRLFGLGALCSDDSAVSEERLKSDTEMLLLITVVDGLPSLTC